MTYAAAGPGGTTLRGYGTRRGGHRLGHGLVGTSSGWVGPAMGNNELSPVLGQRRESCVWEPCMGENAPFVILATTGSEARIDSQA